LERHPATLFSHPEQGKERAKVQSGVDFFVRRLFCDTSRREEETTNANCLRCRKRNCPKYVFSEVACHYIDAEFRFILCSVFAVALMPEAGGRKPVAASLALAV
jgi:hypothetical protein